MTKKQEKEILQIVADIRELTNVEHIVCRPNSGRLWQLWEDPPHERRQAVSPELQQKAFKQWCEAYYQGVDEGLRIGINLTP